MDRTLIDEAARLLRDDADGLRLAHTLDGEWGEETEAKAIHDNMVRVASGMQRQADELVENYAARGLALQAAKAMQAGETERADNAERERDQLAARVEVAEEGYLAAVRQAEWQARTNTELNDLTRQRDSLLEFAQEVRRTGDTRLASMAIAAIAAAKGSAA